MPSPESGNVLYGGLPYQEAIDFLRNKLQIPTKAWDALQGDIHAKAFTIAGATKAALLNDLHQDIIASITNGETITSFRKRFDQTVSKHGWSYKGKRGWRTSLIYNTNKRTARMSARWQKMWNNRKYRPYLQYMDVGDGRVRPLHRLWNGTTLPIEHDWWLTHYPPNGWGCRCTTRSLSKRDLERDGLTVADMDAVKAVKHVNTKTGEETWLVPGIDQGWDYNVGKAWLAPETHFGEQVMSLPFKIRADALDAVDISPADNAFKLFVNDTALLFAKEKTPPKHIRTGGYLTNDILDGLFTNGVIPHNVQLTIRDREIMHLLRDTKTDRGAALLFSHIQNLPEHIRTPDVVLWDTGIGGNRKPNPALIYAFKLDDGRYVKYVFRISLKEAFKHDSTKFKAELNSLRTAGIVQGFDLKGERYNVIIGSVE